jgi:nucleoporin SEH1
MVVSNRSDTSQVLQSSHQDYVLNLAFDHYGRRIATCGADRSVKIWELDENGEWISSAEWNAHISSVTSISWAHPEFGPLLATSGSDGFCTIWEERAEGNVTTATTSTSSTSAASAGTTTPGSTNLNESTTRWRDTATLTDARKGLSSVKFAPRHLRLQLATASADGVVRIYEAVDVMNLSQWLLKSSITVEKDKASELGVTCLDWCSGRFEPPTLVVGDSSGNVNIYRSSDASRSWNLYMKLDGHTQPRKGVLDVSWSPDVGRSFHLISSCGRDGTLRVHRLKKVPQDHSDENEEKVKLSEMILDSSQELETDEDTWRCAWNVTGTVLASSGDGGVVKLWKCNYKGTWKCVSDVHGSLRNQSEISLKP